MNDTIVDNESHSKTMTDDISCRTDNIGLITANRIKNEKDQDDSSDALHDERSATTQILHGMGSRTVHNEFF